MIIVMRYLCAAVLAFFPLAAGAGDVPLFSEEVLKQNKLVDVQTLDPAIRVKLIYATADNFLGKNVYGTLKTCYLRVEAAEKLAKAQKLLVKKYPGYALLVYDGLRPRRIQTQMWEIVKNTPQRQYVASPRGGSIHNYGAAVDLTVADEKGNPLDMGTPFDFFGAKAQPKYEKYFLDPELMKKEKLDAGTAKQIEDEIVKYGKLTEAQLKNRLLLRTVMEQAGFISLSNEWWHFSAFPNEEVRAKFRIVE
jgi:D-alanyl-D-alanine dipeptidase